MLKGLEIAWDRGYQKVMLESDSMLAVKAVLGDTVHVNSNCPLINVTKNFRRKNWETKVCHIFWEANGITNAMANFSKSLPQG